MTLIIFGFSKTADPKERETCLALLSRKTKSLQNAEIAELKSPRMPSPVLPRRSRSGSGAGAGGALPAPAAAAGTTPQMERQSHAKVCVFFVLCLRFLTVLGKKKKDSVDSRL